MNNFKITNHYVWLLLLSFFFYSCNDESLEGDFGLNDEENIFNPNENATFEVELNGELFVATSIDASFTDEGYTVEASNGSQEVNLFLPTLSVNSYGFSTEGNDAFISYTHEQAFPEAFFSGASGTLNVTSLNQEGRIAGGNFDGTLTEILGSTEPIGMTNGLFQDIVFVPGFDDFDFDQIGGDFMTALFDGEVFTADQVVVFTDVDLAQQEEEEEDEDEEDGNEDGDGDGEGEGEEEEEETPIPEPEFIFVRGFQTIDLDIPDIEIPGGDDDNEIDIPDSITIGITLRFPVGQNVGVFEFTQNSAIQASLDSGETVEFATEGVIDVQSFNDGEIRGQFNFTTPSGEVTGGAFRATP